MTLNAQAPDSRGIALALCGSTVEPLVPRRGNFTEWFRAGLGLGASDAPAFALHEGEQLPDPSVLRGVVFSGSPAMVTQQAPWSLAAESWIRAAIEAQLPVLGVCYGHQLLARATGGAVDFNPAGRAIGRATCRLTEAGRRDALLGTAGPSFETLVSHSQVVTTLPPGARVLGVADHDAHFAFRVGTGIGVQFHPEFDADITAGYLEHRRDAIAADGIDVDARLRELVDTPKATGLLGTFERWTGDRSATASAGDAGPQ